MRVCEATADNRNAAWSASLPICASKNPGNVLCTSIQYVCVAGYMDHESLNDFDLASFFVLVFSIWKTWMLGGSGFAFDVLCLCSFVVVVDCGRQFAPANGRLQGNIFTYGATISFSCNAGYALSGSEYRTCQGNGLFSGTAPSCVGKCWS